MLEQNILNAIKKELNKSNNKFFEYSWREKLNELSGFLEEESKYSKLIDWINRQIDLCNNTKNVFSPADKDEKTTIVMVNIYKQLMEKLAILIHCREILLDKRTTNEMRKNIEYTICKLYNVKYSEQLKEYI